MPANKNIYSLTPLQQVNKFRKNSEEKIGHLLSCLGKTADEIASSLNKENILGYNGRSYDCPLKNYLALNAGPYRFEVALKYSGEVAVSFELKGYSFHHVYNNIAVADFIRGFDNGEYSFLNVAKTNQTKSIDEGW